MIYQSCFFIFQHCIKRKDNMVNSKLTFAIYDDMICVFFLVLCIFNMNSEFLINVVGHKKAKNLLNKALQNNRKLSHAYILSGPKGIGKFFLAHEFAKSLKNYKTASPDTFIIHADKFGIEMKKQHIISIDEVRKLEDFLRLTSADNSYRISIIDGAEYMTHNAANALLKILEEPGNNTIIFLITHSISRIIATIRSRCVHIACEALSEEQFIYILRKESDEEITQLDCMKLLHAANNNIGLALKIHKEKLLDLVQKIENCFLTKNIKYINEITWFASESKDNWEIVKTTLIRCTYNIVKSNCVHHLSFKTISDRAIKILNIINNCEKDNLDKTKVITFCLS